MKKDAGTAPKVYKERYEDEETYKERFVKRYTQSSLNNNTTVT